MLGYNYPAYNKTGVNNMAQFILYARTCKEDIKYSDMPLSSQKRLLSLYIKDYIFAKGKSVFDDKFFLCKKVAVSFLNMVID